VIVMPWHVEQGTASCAGWAVVKDADGSVAGCHPSEAEAQAQMAALYAQEPDMAAAACPPGQHKMPDGSCMPDMDMVAAMDAGGTPVYGVACVEGVPDGSSPKRMWAPGSLTFAPTPFAFKCQLVEDEEHRGAMVAGRVDAIWRDGALIRWIGVMDSAGAVGGEAERLMAGGFLNGVSIKADDVDETDVEYVYPPPPDMMMPADDELEEMDVDGDVDFHLPGKHNQKDHGRSTGPKITRGPAPADWRPSKKYYPKGLPGQGGAVDGAVTADGMMMEDPEPALVIYHAGRVRSITLLAEPAFVEATAQLGPSPFLPPVPTAAETIPVGVDTVVTSAAYTITIPEVWPEAWFDEPAEAPPIGALHITPQGRVFGYLGPDRVAHRAFRASGRTVTIPRGVDYSEFQNKPCLVAGADGQVYRINAGNITFDCGHPSPYDERRADPGWAMQHYDNTCSVAARVRVGENRHGTWVAGGLLHGITPDAFERMMACALSGDWQNNRLNAALLVPVEGFPVAQTSSVRVRDDVVVASTVPVRFLPPTAPPQLRPVLERLARSAGRDPASRFAALRQRVGR
jgi:hypothetical protein